MSTIAPNIQTVTANGNTYSVDLNRNMFKLNVYTNNYGSNGFGLVDVQGSPLTYFDGETFTDNGDACEEAITRYASSATPSNLIKAAAEMTISAALATPGSYLATDLMAALIVVKRTAYVSVLNTTFSGNWLLETTYSASRG